MKQEPRIRYTRIRQVKPLVRANQGDAGIDFFVPEDLTLEDLFKCQADSVISSYGITVETSNPPYTYTWVLGNPRITQKIQGDEKVHNGTVHLLDDIKEEFFSQIVTKISLAPNSRVLIPSGIKVLLEPKDSMLMAANKSGVCTKKGLIFGAEIVDSPYVGEIHISLINTSNSSVDIKAGDKVVQFIHVPVYQPETEEISHDLYNQISENWGSRGSKGFGSSDKISEDIQLKLLLDYEDELNMRSY